MLRPFGIDAASRRRDGVVNLRTQHTACGFVQQAASLQMRMLTHGIPVVLSEQGNLGDLIQGDQSGAHAIIDVMRVVGDLVREVAQLRLEARLRALEEAATDPPWLLLFKPFRIRTRAVLQNSLAGFKAEVEAIEIGIAFFQRIDHPQALEVVFEAPVLRHAFVQCVLACMAKRGMSQVVCQGDGLHQVLVEAQWAGDRPGELRDFDRVREARAEQVTLVVEENLRLVDEAPERSRVNDAVAVALKLRARRSGFFRMPSPTRARRITGVGSDAHARRSARAVGQHLPNHVVGGAPHDCVAWAIDDDESNLPRLRLLVDAHQFKIAV
jgi:hypothetical protein